jgi:replicative DNA helicase|tara:strand:+ start:43036 stop:44415 length:1380 start_codon:yes stop_codon:yes gene_type:complete
MDNIEQIIIAHLCHDEDYLRKVIPFVKEDYFTEPDTRQVFIAIGDFVVKYNSLPSKSALLLSLQENRAVTEDLYHRCETIINGLQITDNPAQWLIDETENFCKQKALYNAIMQSIQIIDGNDSMYSKDALPDILSTALGVGFDTNIGHDYVENADERYDFYHREEEKIPFDLDYFNKITEGGLLNKTLNVALAGTGVGKSLFMCHMAASAITQGKNVLYITLEMAEERIAERIDSNMMNVAIQDLKDLSKQMFSDRVEKIKSKVNGKLIIKEYPTASAHSGHFKALIDELKLKKNFSADIIFIDYLNICTSSRIRGGNANSYTIIKSIAEELRGLAVEQDLPIVTATQTTRGGYNNSDVELTDTSESFGLPATADLMFALISTEELEQQGHIMVKQLKNRYSDPTRNKRFMIGVDRSKMRLYDLEESAQQNITDSGQDNGPVFDNSSAGQRVNLEKINF